MVGSLPKEGWLINHDRDGTARRRGGLGASHVVGRCLFECATFRGSVVDLRIAMVSFSAGLNHNPHNSLSIPRFPLRGVRNAQTAVALRSPVERLTPPALGRTLLPRRA